MRWRSRGLGRGRREEEEEEEKRWKGGGRPFICSHPRYLPKMDGCSLLPFFTSRGYWLWQVTMRDPTLHVSGKFKAHFKEITNERKDVAVKVITAWDILSRL